MEKRLEFIEKFNTALENVSKDLKKKAEDERKRNYSFEAVEYLLETDTDSEGFKLFYESVYRQGFHDANEQILNKLSILVKKYMLEITKESR